MFSNNEYHCRIPSLRGWKINLKQKKKRTFPAEIPTQPQFTPMAWYALCMAGLLSFLPPVVRQVSRSNIIDYSGTDEY